MEENKTRRTLRGESIFIDFHVNIMGNRTWVMEVREEGWSENWHPGRPQ